MNKIYMLLSATIISFSPLLAGNDKYGELVKNNDFKSGLQHWKYHGFGNKSKIDLRDDHTVVISSSKQNGKGNITQSLKTKDLPGASYIKLSCIYRTENVINSKGYCYLELKYNYKKDGRQNQKMVLPPSKEWKYVESIRKIKTPIDNILLVGMIFDTTGALIFKNISVMVLPQEGIIRKGKTYIWREGEDITTHLAVTDWKPKEEAENPYFHSGKGGVVVSGENLEWCFHIKEKVNPDSLLPEKKEYYVWLRLYGYLEKPEVVVRFDDKVIKTFKTRRLERSDDTGKYIGGGAYYWQDIGSFSSAGGKHSLKIQGKGRCFIDALLVTDDPKYKPRLFEAAKVTDKVSFTDVSPGHVVKPVYKINGISNKITSPLTFRFYPENNKPVTVAEGKSPIRFCLLLPQMIKVNNICSHWAGTEWKSSRSPKPLKWIVAGKESKDGKVFKRYEIYLHYLWGSIYAFIKADGNNFIENQDLKGYCWLEYNNKKQIPDQFTLKTVKLEQTKPFRKIFIGPSGGHARSFFLAYPGLVQSLEFAGINFINPWHIQKNLYLENWTEFNKKCKKANIIVLGEHSPFAGIFGPKKKSECAVDIHGHITHKPSLIIPEDSPTIKTNLDYIIKLAESDLDGIVFDDEEYNQVGDKFDYNPAVKEKFRTYLARKTDFPYKDPIDIVKNKLKEKALYNAWVDFKCDLQLARYKLYKATFDKAYKTDSGRRPLFIPMILKNKSPQESKTNSFWDYKKLADIATHISPMIYTYQGIQDSERVGNIVKMYNKYIGRPVIVPTILTGHGGFGEIKMPDKKMIYYQMLEALMQKSPGIIFWNTYSALDPLQLQYISQAIKIAGPYEDFFSHGNHSDVITTKPDWIQSTALKYENKMLLYLTNYRNPTGDTIRVTVPQTANRILDLQTGKTIELQNQIFNTEFSPETRGKLFLITMKE